MQRNPLWKNAGQWGVWKMILNELGLVQVYTGDGKGKTTAALGLAFRAIGHGFKVQVVQFMKGSTYSGELAAAARLYPSIQITQFGLGCKYSALIRQGMMKCQGCGECFIKNRGKTREDEEMAAQAMDFVRQIMQNKGCDILILDEIGNALRYGLVTDEQVLELISNKPEKMELVMTGRGISETVQQAADLVTEIKAVKHPFKKGITSRRGIEY